MRKVPTLFVRDPEDMRHVIPEVTLGCSWVLAGEGVATRKYDGTCVMLDQRGKWWARRDVKPGRPTPLNFVAVEGNKITGKTVGWEPIGQSSFAKFHREALEGLTPEALTPGTYELCGPKINRNPERYMRHTLVSHDHAERILVMPDALTYEGLRRLLLDPRFFFEGIVWHHPDGRMAKLKSRDFD